jgi:hypothetical protein
MTDQPAGRLQTSVSFLVGPVHTYARGGAQLRKRAAPLLELNWRSGRSGAGARHS